MSALLAPVEARETSTGAAARPARASLRSVANAPLRASRVVFMVVLLALLGSGMVGVLLLNTKIQERAATVTAAQRAADDLGHQQASLTARVEQLRSSSDLATRAWALGMRPNPYPVFVQLGVDGAPAKVVGEPMRVTGAELPNQRYVGADEVTRAIQEARAKVAAEEAAARKAAAERLAAEKKAAAERRAAEEKAAAQQAAAEQAAAGRAAAAGTAASAAAPSATTKSPGTR